MRANNDVETNNHPADHNNLAAAVIAIETELGTNPKGSSSDVKTRLGTLAVDSTVAHLAGTETLTGAKTLNSLTAASATLPTSGTKWLNVKITGDSSDRLQVYADGTIQWLDGAGGVLQKIFYNNSDSFFEVDDTIRFNSSVRAQSNVAFNGNATLIGSSSVFTVVNRGATDIWLESNASGDTQERWTVDISGKQSWGTGSAVTDTSIARTGVGILSLGSGKLQSSATPSTGNDYINKTYGDSTYLSLEGSLSSRPSPSSVPAGAIYNATDDLGGTLWRSDGSKWSRFSNGSNIPSNAFQYTIAPTVDFSAFRALEALTGQTLTTSGTVTSQGATSLGTAGLRVQTGAVSGNTASISTPFTVFAHDFRPGLRTTIRTGLSTSSIRIWAGMFGSSPFGSDTAPGAAVNAYGFRYSTAAADAAIKFVVWNGTSQTLVDTGITINSSTSYELAFGFADGSDLWWTVRKVNTGVITTEAAGTTADAGTTFSGFILGTVVGVETLTAAARTIDIGKTIGVLGYSSAN